MDDWLLCFDSTVTCSPAPCAACRAFQGAGILLGTGGGAQRLHWMLEGAFDEELQALTPNFLAVSLGAQHAAHLCRTTKLYACTALPPI